MANSTYNRIEKVTVFLGVVLFISVFLSSCAHGSTCIETGGVISGRSVLLGRGELRNNKPTLDHKVIVNCRGRYQYWIVFIPQDNVEVVVTDDGKKRYKATTSVAGGGNKTAWVEPHRIDYEILVESVEDQQKSVRAQGGLEVPAHQFGISPIEIRIPRDFRIGEEFSITVSILADDKFFLDYKWLGASIRVPLH